jgi:hypothetical protein
MYPWHTNKHICINMDTSADWLRPVAMAKKTLEDRKNSEKAK